MAKTKKQGENSACSALFEHAYYSSGYGNKIFRIYETLTGRSYIQLLEEDKRDC